MKKKVLIVEDQFIEANDIQLMLQKAGYEVCGIARSVPIAQEMIKIETPSLVLLDIFLKGKLTGIDLARQLKEKNIAFVYLSANSNEEILSEAKTTEPYGFIVKPFREKDLLVTLEIAQYRHEHSREASYRREEELLQLLEKAVHTNVPPKEKLLQIGMTLQQEIPFDYLMIHFNATEKGDGNAIGFLRIGFHEYQTIELKELATITGINQQEVSRLLVTSKRDASADFFNREAFNVLTQKLSLERLLHETFQVRAMLSYPLPPCNFCFYSRREDTYNASHTGLLRRLQPAILRNLETAVSPSKAISDATLVNETRPSPKIDAGPLQTSAFNSIVGHCHLLLNVFDQISQVALFDTSVLLLGETGTGKERIAECIHNLSPRKKRALVRVNCAALPATLIESELFGHEKGAFTGATEKRIGKFEQASGGTIFLDEIGEMPVDLQVKLLRVLQEKEIEPIGGRSSIKIDVRFIAATNRNLEKEVAEGRFRLDLYYRLNVFPILIPPLRERTEDIPDLVQHFISIYSQKAGKTITGLSAQALEKMRNYAWPGNIRELEHLIERSVLLAKGPVIEDVLLSPTHTTPASLYPQSALPKSFSENERDYIISVLKQCKGKIWGIDGAAELLKVPPSTLKSKMKKLGIRKESY